MVEISGSVVVFRRAYRLEWPFQMDANRFFIDSMCANRIKHMSAESLMYFPIVFYGLTGTAIVLGLWKIYDLQRINRQLRLLNREQSEFLSIAAHQLRTPLTIIKGFLSLIMDGTYGKVNKDVREALEKIFASSENSVKLVEDLLNVSRIELGKMEFHREKCDIAVELKRIAEDFSLIAERKGLSLALKLPRRSLPKLCIDPVKMREVFSDLLENAMKYTERGGITISVEKKPYATALDSDGYVCSGVHASNRSVVRVCVADSGIGISQEDIPYLFKKFSRGKDPSRLHVPGTGLGLYLGKCIVEAHGGLVWVESKGENRGAIFIIELPISEESQC